MTKQVHLFINFLIVTALINGVCYAQSPTIDSAVVSMQKAKVFFDTEIKSQSRLFNGVAYLTYGSNVKGSANFQDLSLTSGSVIYDGIRYDNVPLLYDLYLDNIVTASFGNSAMISLIKDKVSDFYINKHHFIYLNKNDNPTETQIASGFYDLIYDGQFRVLVKRYKKLQFSTNVETPYYFTAKTTYFLERDGKHYEFSSESSFFNLFKEKKNEMKKHLKESNIKFKDNPDEAISLLASYYEQIQN